MLVIENKSESCVTVNVHGLKPLTFAGRGARITFKDVKAEYSPYANAMSVFFQAGILKTVQDAPKAPAVVEPLAPAPVAVPPVEIPVVEDPLAPAPVVEEPLKRKKIISKTEG